MQDALADLQARGLAELTSGDTLGEILRKEPLTFYCGYDPTAPSLQIGNLCAILTMRRLQLAGHKPIALMGGATGMIGDPSGKSAERNLLDEAAIARNLAGQRLQLERLLDFSGPSGATLVNNADWLAEFNLIAFLRDVGKRFRLGEMLAKESVKRRLESDTGLSFTEFTYQILQAYDFLWLWQNRGVRMQIGGSDQWGNITAGIDLIRKVEGAEAHGLVIPLVTDAQGRKFGKSESGTIFLDAALTSPYQMYQYLLNSDDLSVVRFLKIFTFLPLEEIAALERDTRENPGARTAQKMLAGQVVELVHGRDGLAAAERATRILFGEKIEQVSDADLAAIFADVPAVTIAREALSAGITIADLLVQTPLFKSKGEAKRGLEQGGVYLNNSPIADLARIITTADLATPTALVLRKGKKSYCVVRVENEYPGGQASRLP